MATPSVVFLQSLKVFEQYPENILQELSRYALHDTFLANTTREFSDPPTLPSL